MEGARGGTETLLLLVRETPLPADAPLPALLETLPCHASHFIKPQWYENWVPQTRGEVRSINVSRTDPIKEIAYDRHQVLQDKLAAYFSYSLSVSFSYAGEVA